MFGSRRKKGAPLPPLDRTTANPNAATAALSAFKHQRQESSGSLSAAAAAAALKARPTTPTNVAEVQTKRTARRSASVSSAGTAPELGERPGGGLQRRGSSGSLTERTFRSQSPGRPSSAGGQPRSSFNTEDMPPVPSIPKDVEARESAKSGRKSLGFKSAPLRVASQKLGKEGSGSWFGSAKAGDPSNVRTSDAALTSPPPPEKEWEREGRPSSRGSSINFSYPARVRLGSPPPDSPTIAEAEPKPQLPPPQAQPEVQRRQSKRASTLSPARGGGVRSPRPASIASDRELVYDPNSRRMVPRADLAAVEQNVLSASEKRPKKKKQPASKAGSHLAQGTMGRPHGSAVDNGVENEAQKAAAASLRSHRAEEHRHTPREEEEDDDYEYEQPVMQAVSPSPRQTQRKIISPEPTRQGQRTSLSPASSAPEVYAGQHQQTERRSSNQFLGRKPSMVREEEEPEAGELDSHAVASQSTATGSPSQQPAQQTRIISPQPIAIPHAAPAELPAAPTPPPAEPPAAFRIDRGTVTQTEAIRRERSHSNSPARTAHFGPVQDSLTVRHSPPPRSISPRKSALKQQSPSRGASPEDDASETSSTRAQTLEPPMPRKKSVRVSFDDQNTVVVGESAPPEPSDSPVILSPQNSKRVPWYSKITRSKKEEIPALDDDEIMQPRPALPMFGSVREKKQTKEVEERPLVRPAEAAPSPPMPASPTLKPSIASVTEAEPVGQSSDHAIGALLQEPGPRTEANISKQREPLPPVVTSIEGGGYMSDTSSSSDSEAELIADTPKLEPEMSQASTLITEPESQLPPVNGSAELPEASSQGQSVVAKGFAEKEPEGPLPEPVKTPERTVPSIAITQPSPRLPDGRTPPRDYLDVPGGFPDTDSELEEPVKLVQAQPVITETEVPSTPVRKVTFEPVIQRDDTLAASQTASTALATTIPIIQDDDSDSSGVYSDAYEDLSDIEGDGFQSLDAVVESPLITTPPQSAFAKARAAQLQGESPTPSPRPTDDKPLTLAPEVSGPAQSPPDDWETAKAYWRSLTADKRAQLEKEAVEDAGAEGDLEEVQPEEKKPRRKKSVEKRVAEKKIIEEQRNVDPERTYMIKPGTRVEADAYNSAPVKTMRKQQGPAPAPAGQPATRMRKSMRGAEQPQPRASAAAGGVAAGGAAGGGTPRIRKSMRTNGPEPAQQRPAAQNNRPVSYQPPGSVNRQAQGHVRTMSDQSYQSSQASARAAAGASAIQPTLRRRGSDSSESSFKRARTRPGEGFGFRKSMRGQGHEPSNSMDSGRPSSSRFSLRSLSPNGSPFRRSSTVDSPPVSMGNRMKTSLRSSAEPQRKTSRLSSFGLSSKPKAASKSKKASRFGDSSDEDEPHQGFRSRFDDSSDEDAIPEKLPPLAIPKNARGNIAATRTTIPTSQTLHEEDEQSSDLPDSDEERKQPQRTPSGRNIKQVAGTPTIQRSGSGRGALVSSPTSPVSPSAGGRPANQKRRSSFMSALRRKKPDSVGKISRGEMMDSAARRDTNLERSASELNAIRINSGREQPSSPKLQKRQASFPAPPARTESWPLPDEDDDDEPEIPASDEEKQLQRPSTSGNLEAGGGKTAASRPGILQRRTMSMQGTIDTYGVGGEKKKKKFSALRRMLKLDD